MEFLDVWIWLIFVVIGLLLVLTELIIGVETSLDLVFIGSAFIVGGLATWPFSVWWITVIVTAVICIAYVTLGRRYVHRWVQVSKAKTNIDAIVGKRGVVLQAIGRNADGLVKVENEQWRARAQEDVTKGAEIVVTGVSGVTLLVEKPKGGD